VEGDLDKGEAVESPEFCEGAVTDGSACNSAILRGEGVRAAV